MRPATSRGEPLPGAEGARLGAEMAAIRPPYEAYQKKTAREIPVVGLERR